MSNHLGARRCFFCEVSTVRGPRRRQRRHIQSYLLTEDYIAAHPSVINYAESRVGARPNLQISPQDRICRPCLQRAERYVIAQRKAQEEAEAELDVHQAAINEAFERSPGQSSSGEQPSDSLRVSPEEIPQKIDLNEEQEIVQPQSTITLSDYKRVSCNSHYCIIAGCNQTTNLHRMNLTIRLHILSKQHIYIPRGNRVCTEHLEAGALQHDDFASICRSLHDTFNSAQISDMLAMTDKRGLQY